VSFEELCRRLGGELRWDRIHNVLSCVVNTLFWRWTVENNAGIIEQMIRDAAERGVKAEVIIGDIFAGSMQGVGLYVDPRDGIVGVWSTWFSGSLKPERVEVKKEVLEEELEKNGFDIYVKADVERNPITGNLHVVADAVTGIPLNELSANIVLRAVDAVIDAAEDAVISAAESLEKPIEE